MNKTRFKFRAECFNDAEVYRHLLMNWQTPTIDDCRLKDADWFFPYDPEKSYPEPFGYRVLNWTYKFDVMRLPDIVVEFEVEKWTYEELSKVAGSFTVDTITS